MFWPEPSADPGSRWRRVYTLWCKFGTAEIKLLRPRRKSRSDWKTKPQRISWEHEEQTLRELHILKNGGSRRRCHKPEPLCTKDQFRTPATARHRHLPLATAHVVLC